MAIWTSMAKHFLKKDEEGKKLVSRKCPQCKKQVEPEHFKKEGRAHWRCPKCGHTQLAAR